ncbi:META domain-containing protein [Dongia deserti]|uniref:META domain-containing protein n=1 Tax=Dongia deserti TaxID=2268030 RepID=UPI000E64A5FD|nr:META domain-containing protein [Dongia deserti]
MPAFARNKLLWAALLLGSLVAGYGCWWLFTDRGSLFFGRDGTSFWTVTSFAEEPVEPHTLLLFDENQLVLDGPCGAQRWVYERDDDVIEISRPSGATLRCAVAPTPPIIDQFSAVRTTVTTLNIEGEHLKLLDEQGKPVLEAQRLAATSLENRTWHIESFQLDDALTSTSDVFDESAQVHITFIRGTLHGYAGCRYLVGMYKLDPEWILIDVQHHPAAYFCRQRNVELSEAILAALSASNILTREQDRIVLKDSENRIQAILTPWPTRPMP